MSAYVVDRNHIRFLIAAATWTARRERSHGFSWYQGGHRHEMDERNEAEGGQMLWDENVASVERRYPGSDYDLPGPIDQCRAYGEHKMVPAFSPTPAQILKAADCYEYQSCEHPGWEASSAKGFIDSLRHSAWRLVEGYDDAPWGAPPLNDQPARSMVSLADLGALRGRKRD